MSVDSNAAAIVSVKKSVKKLEKEKDKEKKEDGEFSLADFDEISTATVQQISFKTLEKDTVYYIQSCAPSEMTFDGITKKVYILSLSYKPNSTVFATTLAPSTFAKKIDAQKIDITKMIGLRYEGMESKPMGKDKEYLSHMYKLLQKH